MLNEPVNILLDNSIYQKRIIAEPVVVQNHFQWGGIDQNIPVQMYQRKEFNKEQKDHRKAIETIANQARNDGLKLFQYIETEFESIRATPIDSNLKGSIGDLLRNIDIDHVQSPFPRGYVHKVVESPENKGFQQFIMSKNEARNNNYTDSPFIRFVKWLWKITPEEIEELKAIFKDLNLSGLDQINKFKLLVQNIDEKHIDDAFHLFAADFNQIDYFLTGDKKFINVCRNKASQTLQKYYKVYPISPEDYCSKILDLEKDQWDNLPMASNCYYNIFEIG